MQTIIDQIQKEIIKNFKSIENDRLATIEYIIDIGQNIPQIDEKDKTENNLIKGCTSKVWLKHNIENNTMTFKADSNTAITKGLLYLIIKTLNKQSPKNIYNANLFFIKEIKMDSFISSQRLIGLDNIIQHIKNTAKKNLTQINTQPSTQRPY